MTGLSDRAGPWWLWTCAAFDEGDHAAGYLCALSTEPGVRQCASLAQCREVSGEAERSMVPDSERPDG